jgi:hypothetical protein
VRILLSKPELDPALVNLTVTDGNVRLWGVVENADEAAVAESAAKFLPGVEVSRKQSPPRADFGCASIECFAKLCSAGGL